MNNETGESVSNCNVKSAEESKYRYTGQEYDEETDLHNYKARFYDSMLMRFYSVDPAEEQASPYTYVANNPVMLVDPSGKVMTEALKKLPQIREISKTKYGKQYITNLENSKITFSLGDSFDGEENGRVKKITKNGEVVEVRFEFNKETFLFDYSDTKDDDTKLKFFLNVKTTFHEILHAQDIINGITSEQAIYVPEKVYRWKNVLNETAKNLYLNSLNRNLNKPNKELKDLSYIEYIMFNSHDLKSNMRYFENLGGKYEKDKLPNE